MALHDESGSAPRAIESSPAAAAARAVRAHWDARRPFFVADPRTPPARRGEQLRRLASHRLEPEAALVVASSGTTGSPRLVVHGRAQVETACRAVNEALAVDPARDRWLACVPLHFVAGLAIVLRAELAGVPVTLHDGFDVDAVAAAAGECTLVSLVATQLHRLLEAGAPLHRFRAVLLGGGPIPDHLRRRAEDRGVPLHVTYGLSETFGGCVHDGRALPGTEVSLTSTGARSTVGTGEIRVGGPVMLGYHGDPERSAEALTPTGRLRTGDLGRFDADGRLAVIDRLRDLVITGGVNVSPTTVEAVLACDPAVHDVAVVGAPDAEWGERVVACVVPMDADRPPSLDALRARAAAELTPAELPRELRLVTAVPRTGSGKPRRALLREPAAPPAGRRDAHRPGRSL